jgi:hypothetical protein
MSNKMQGKNSAMLGCVGMATQRRTSTCLTQQITLMLFPLLTKSQRALRPGARLLAKHQRSL